MLTCASCGRRGDPRPPELQLPRAPQAVALSAPGGRPTVSWTAPRDDLGGRTLTGEVRYRVVRRAWPPGEAPCEGCPEDLRPVAEVDPAARKTQGLPETSWTDPDASPGWTYRYRVEATDRRGRPGPSSGPAQILWTPLPAPRTEALPGDAEVLLRTAPAEVPPGFELLGLRVYDASSRRVGAAAPGQWELRVGGLPNGVPWTGSVHLAARTPEGWEVESPGTPASAVPIDAVPPLPPSDLVALAEPEGVFLHWAPSGAERYAEVIVLRADEGDFAELARLKGEAVSYVDASAAPGRTYRYSVRARDAAGNESLPAREAVIRAR
ncbi:MAG: hypothetical protein AB1578_04065 [Thermodesulfobacteriota bacterium]